VDGSSIGVTRSGLVATWWQARDMDLWNDHTQRLTPVDDEGPSMKFAVDPLSLPLRISSAKVWQNIEICIKTNRFITFPLGKVLSSVLNL